MGVSARERAEELMQLRRQLAESWPDTPSKDVVLRVLDEMIWEAHRDELEAE
jgi:hypothetical protein